MTLGDAALTSLAAISHEEWSMPVFKLHLRRRTVVDPDDFGLEFRDLHHAYLEVYRTIPSALNFEAPAASWIGRRFETVVRQQYDFSCGSAALATLLRFHYDDPQDEQSVFLGMWRDGDQAQIRRLGFSLLDMKRYLAKRSIGAEGYKVSLEQIATARILGIALINFNGYRHFVVVVGIDRETMLLGDPSLGLRRESRRTFARQWNGVYFVVTGRDSVGRAHFAMARDEVRAPEGRVFPAGSLLDLASLALTRPLPGEF